MKQIIGIAACICILAACGSRERGKQPEVYIQAGAPYIEQSLTCPEGKLAKRNELHPEGMTEIEKMEKLPAKKFNIPKDFVYVDDIIANILLDIRYYTDYNFVGEKIDGYTAPLAILTREAAEALKLAADRFAEDGYTIKIFDAYRPQKAVSHFVEWSGRADDSTKEVFYPAMEKASLFSDGYISRRSRHSRGSTVDLTIVDKEGKEVDMGGYFDLLDTRSNFDTDLITDEQHANRAYLREVMEEAGFEPIRTEWWHFQLQNEPFPDTYFDFDIE